MGVNDNKEIKLDFWAKLFTIIRKTFYPKKTTNPMELHISEEKSHLRTMKQIILPTKLTSIRNPEWQTFSWDIRKLKNILQLHKNDPHTHGKEGIEHYPTRCNFRMIIDKYCIQSIEQLGARQVRMEQELYLKIIQVIHQLP